MEENKALKKKLWIAAAIYAGMIFLILILANTEKIDQWLSGVFRIFRPVTTGLIIAYLCNPVFRFFERRVFFRIRFPKARRSLSLLCAFLAFLLLIALILLLIIPQLIDSITSFTKNYQSYFSSAIGQLNGLIEAVNGIFAQVLQKDALIDPIDPSSLPNLLGTVFGSNGLLAKFSIEFGSVVGAISRTFSAITDFILGLFIAIYLLSTKEKRAAQFMKLRRAIFSDRINTLITQVLSTAHRTFGGFLIGKLLDSLIIGILTYIITSLFGIQYALLISTFIGITNIIPVVGPIIGAVPTAFILLLSQPEKVLIFVLIIIFIQQLDGNIIGPKILGENTGISSLCVIIAITTMGTVWGLTGMLLGVPLFATVLELFEIFIIDKLQKKGLPSGLGNYYASDVIADPSSDIRKRSGKRLSALEREYLHTERLIKNDVSVQLTKKQVFCYRLYKLGVRVRLIDTLSEEVLLRYALEETAKEAETASDEAFQTYMEAYRPTAQVTDSSEVISEAEQDSVAQEQHAQDGGKE